MLNDPIQQTHTCLFSSSQVDLWSSFSKSKSRVGWWREKERVFNSYIPLLNALNPETRRQDTCWRWVKPRRLPRKAEAAGGCPGRMLEHPPALPVPQPSFKRQHRKTQQKGKATREAIPPGAPLTPLLFWGSSCLRCIVVGLKGAEGALSELRSCTGRD